MRRAAVTVMGPRTGIRPVMSQDADGRWVFHPESVTADVNAIDQLVRATLAER